MQRDILSQDEIDILLSGERGGSQSEAVGMQLDASSPAPYDFTGHGALAWGKIPALDLIYTRFSRQLSQSLSTFISRLVEVELVSSESTTFGEFIRTLPLPTSLHLFTMRPLHGIAVMALDSALAFFAIECLFGGTGRSRINVEGREFTAIEQRVIARVVILVLQELEKAWEPVYQVNMTLERSEVNPYLISAVPSRDAVILTTLEVRLEDISGFIRVCVPYGLLQPIRGTLEGSSHSLWVDRDCNWVTELQRALLNAEVEIVVQLGEASINTEQFLKLEVGDVIPLDRGIHEALTVIIENIPKAKALPGTLNNRRAIKVTSLSTQRNK